jgi:TPR repeat protein
VGLFTSGRLIKYSWDGRFTNEGKMSRLGSDLNSGSLSLRAVGICLLGFLLFSFLSTASTPVFAQTVDRIELLRRLVAEGHAIGQYELAQHYMAGEWGLPQDDREAIRLYKLAAGQGYPPAQRRLADFYYWGDRGFRRDRTEAARLLMLTVERGNMWGISEFLDWYDVGKDGSIREKNKDKRGPLLRYKFPGKAEGWRLYIAAFNYRVGAHGVTKNESEASRYYKLAAERDIGPAQYEVAMLLIRDHFANRRRGNTGQDNHEAEVVRLYKLAADQGHSTAQQRLGERYEKGRGLAKDEREAARYYRLAAAGGNRSALISLGRLYETGIGVAKDEREARRWYELGVAVEFDEAKTRLDKLLSAPAVAAVTNPASWPAVGMPKAASVAGAAQAGSADAERVSVLRQQASENRVNAQYLLGTYHDAGSYGVSLNKDEATRLYKLAANQGFAPAQYELAERYAYGITVAKNEREALRLYRLAAAEGHDGAKERLRGLGQPVVAAPPSRPVAVASAPTPAPAASAPVPVAPKPAPVVIAAVPPPAAVAPVPAPPAATTAVTQAMIAAERRVALVIGNGRYRAVPELPNPANDARAVAVALRAHGFASVRVVSNATRAELAAALSDFQREADTADWAMIYYAGHGIEIGGINYLVPVDARLRDDRDVADEAMPMNRALDAISGARKLKLVVLDACRDNPFLQKMRRVMASRSTVSRGLAAVDPIGATLVVFAAKDGETALDGDGGNSPFTASLVKWMAEPGVEINLMFRLVTDDVLTATANRQRPFVYGSLPGRAEYYFKVR